MRDKFRFSPQLKANRFVFPEEGVNISPWPQACGADALSERRRWEGLVVYNSSGPGSHTLIRTPVSAIYNSGTG